MSQPTPSPFAGLDKALLRSTRQPSRTPETSVLEETSAATDQADQALHEVPPPTSKPNSPTPVRQLDSLDASVLASTPPHRDLVDDGVTGSLVRAGDPEPLAGALTEMLADPARAAEMGRNGLARVRMFTASAVVGRIEDVYRRVSAQTRGS